MLRFLSICVLLFGLWQSAFSDQFDIHTTKGVDCSRCHECRNPTKQNPCLKPCPRPFRNLQSGTKMTSGQGPDIVILDELENLYEPVKFSHKLHADMANMNGGCVSCHHFTPTNEAHPPCKSCHSPQVLHDHVEQPGLKGAYHRQCINCHRDWSKETDCEICHALKAKKEAEGENYKPRHYQPCREPERLVYRNEYEKGPVVTFFHSLHAHNYGLTCNDCHREDPCVACHYQGKKPVSVVNAQADLMHHKCSACHNITAKGSCKKCHAKQEKTSFQHSFWPLSRYHQKLTCNQCHPGGKPISKLDKNCNACHRGWNSENFKHSRVGIELNEIHIEMDCADCHVDRKFDQAPSCDNCHDEISYPSELPGKKVKK